ncbi:MAG TPA: hypothetical protein VG013_27715 [Gemmataceae bacterium]|nr:hypothetical protein [Gemmataceae bacterium]
MHKDPRSPHPAIGFRVKSGWATAVLVAGPIESPHVLDRRVIDLCDPAIPESRQPYHARMGTLETDEIKVERRRDIVVAATRRSITELMRDYRKAGHRVGAVGLVVGSDIDPARITNPHIRAHALEGRLFRTVLVEAMCSRRLPCSVIVERHVYTRAAEVLGRSEDDLRRSVAQLGRSLGGPWRSEEKVASLAAWVAAARRAQP